MLNKLIWLQRILLVLVLVFLIVGFIFAAYSPETVWVAIVVGVIGGALWLTSLVIIAMRSQEEKKATEERLKKLEEELALLKRR